MLRRVALVRIDVSEELSASDARHEEIQSGHMLFDNETCYSIVQVLVK
jgi:hypothetical protein